MGVTARLSQSLGFWATPMIAFGCLRMAKCGMILGESPPFGKSSDCWGRALGRVSQWVYSEPEMCVALFLAMDLRSQDQLWFEGRTVPEGAHKTIAIPARSNHTTPCWVVFCSRLRFPGPLIVFKWTPFCAGHNPLELKPDKWEILWSYVYSNGKIIYNLRCFHTRGYSCLVALCEKSWKWFRAEFLCLTLFHFRNPSPE